MRICETKRGRFIVNENDVYLAKSLMVLGEFAEGQVSLFEQVIKPWMICVDAGANIGAHTVVLAKLSKYVHAYEPQRAIYHTLCGNVALNGLTNVSCHHKALSNTKGKIPIPVLDYECTNNLGAFNIEGDGVKLDEVEVEPLETKCNFLKIDVEGHELKMLEGAEPMIRECKPIIYIENDRKEQADALISRIREMGYTPFWHVTPLYNQDNFNGAGNPFGVHISSIDMFCVPSNAKVSGLEEAVEGSFEKLFVMAPRWSEMPDVAA